MAEQGRVRSAQAQPTQPPTASPHPVSVEEQHFTAILDHIDSIGMIGLTLPNSDELAAFLVHVNHAKNALVDLQAATWQRLTDVMQVEDASLTGTPPTDETAPSDVNTEKEVTYASTQREARFIR